MTLTQLMIQPCTDWDLSEPRHASAASPSMDAGGAIAASQAMNYHSY